MRGSRPVPAMLQIFHQKHVGRRTLRYVHLSNLGSKRNVLLNVKRGGRVGKEAAGGVSVISAILAAGGVISCSRSWRAEATVGEGRAH